MEFEQLLTLLRQRLSAVTDLRIANDELYEKHRLESIRLQGLAQQLSDAIDALEELQRGEKPGVPF